MQTKVSYSGKEVLQMTFIPKEEKRAAVFKAGRDRPTLLFCANALGFMLRIAIIHKAANPRALKGKDKHELLVLLFAQEGPDTRTLSPDSFHQ